MAPWHWRTCLVVRYLACWWQCQGQEGVPDSGGAQEGHPLGSVYGWALGTIFTELLWQVSLGRRPGWKGWRKMALMWVSQTGEGARAHMRVCARVCAVVCVHIYVTTATIKIQSSLITPTNTNSLCCSVSSDPPSTCIPCNH